MGKRLLLRCCDQDASAFRVWFSQRFQQQKNSFSRVFHVVFADTNSNGGQATDLGSVSVGDGTIEIMVRRRHRRSLCRFTGKLFWPCVCSFPGPYVAGCAVEVVSEVFGITGVI